MPDILHLSPFGSKIYRARLCQGPCLKPLLCNMVLLDINFQLPGSLLAASCCTGVMKALSALSISGKSFLPTVDAADPEILAYVCHTGQNSFGSVT